MRCLAVPSPLRLASVPGPTARCARLAPTSAPRRVAAHAALDVSGEWAAVDSLGSQDDILAWYNNQHESKNTRLQDIMQTNLVLTSPEASLEEAVALLDGPPSIEGMPVVTGDKQLVGVLSRKDLGKGGALVRDVMSAQPVALKAGATVSEAATLMIKHSFHRVPVVDDGGACVGIVTRSDIFWALTQTDNEDDTLLSQHGLDV